MSRRRRSGTSYIEFAFALMFLVPLTLGVNAFGMNLLLAYQSCQLSRDAGHMYARQVNFALAGNQTILAKLGAGVGLSPTAGVSGSAGAGKSVIVFTTVGYVDGAACGLGGLAANKTACPNLNSWVFKQRIVVGDSNLKLSNYGSPITSSGGPGKPPAVTIDSSGDISTSDQLTNPNDVATFAAINPYTAATGSTAASGLPSGQVIYIAEVAARGFVLPPYQSNPMQYVYNMF